MPNRGVLFAVSNDIADKLLTLPREKLVSYVERELEDMFFENAPDYTAELDKSWDAIHRSLTDGALNWENGEYPLNHVILGGQVLYGDEENDDYLIVFKTAEQVQDISEILSEVSEEQFKKGYAKINIADYGYQLGFEDLEYTVKWFLSMKQFWQNAAKDNRAVIFTVDL